MPLRSTLHDAIKVQHYLGQLSAERAEWLAAHKNHPLLFWAGVEQGFNRTVKDEAGQVEHLIRDAGGFINTYALKHFADTYPMRDLACFACNWMGEAPELVNESLVHELLNLKRRLADDQSVAVDTSVLSSALEDTLENISKDLTNRIQAAQPAGEDDISTLSFTSTADPQGGLIVGTDFMVGVDLDIDDDLLNGDTWAGVKLALGLINRHLHPLETPNEIETFDAMMLDEAEDDLVAIATYLCDNDLEPTEQNVEDALIETDSWCIDCYQTWEHMVDQKAFHEETEERWRPVELTTPEALASVIERLTEPTSEAEKQLHDWLREVHRSVCRVMETHTATGSDHLVNGIAAIYQPVFLTKETTVLESLEMTHESLMSGEPEEWTPIPWNTHPRRLRELADRLGLGAALLRKLTTISTAPS
ncbi:hypothetical protein [Marinobacter subterrani]|uniref:hypothetical protein n=1 Tax=Marinobacter subterrani TaxID=1658765 RepID=UPI00235421AB|nr:hypothetical protein [Marinobacter subterrani]